MKNIRFGDNLDPALRFFACGQQDWHFNACVGRQVSCALAPGYYSRGFRQAADALVLQLLEDNRVDLPLDTAVYPVVFLYRHHFELLLKQIITTGHCHIGKPPTPPKTHQLANLWNTAQPLVKECLPEFDWSNNRVVTALLRELSDADPNGEAARYATSKSGVRHFAMMSVLHVRHFARVAAVLSDYLNMILDYLEIAESERLEWEAEMVWWSDASMD